MSAGAARAVAARKAAMVGIVVFILKCGVSVDCCFESLEVWDIR